MKTPEGTAIISLHVDDILLTSPSIKFKSNFERHLQKTFEITIQENNVSYLSLDIKRYTSGITVCQRGYTETILKKYRQSRSNIYPKTPATASLLDNIESEPTDRTKYLSITMSLMYLARFTRPDILMPTTYLATKCSKPTVADLKKCQRILDYLAGTLDYKLHFSRSASLQPTIYADASHHIHADSSGHGGIVITLGSSPIHIRSFKLKCVTRSSTESELVALEEASTYATWLKHILEDMNVAVSQPITILQDNTSAMSIAKYGANFARTKHIMNKYHFLKQLIETGIIRLVYCPTDRMIADILTKPLALAILARILALLGLRK
jgi:hypothetical protein